MSYGVAVFATARRASDGPHKSHGYLTDPKLIVANRDLFRPSVENFVLYLSFDVSRPRTLIPVRLFVLHVSPINPLCRRRSVNVVWSNDKFRNFRSCSVVLQRL